MRVYSSKTSMSDACFHNFDFNRMIYKAINTDDLPSALANSVPSILRLFIQILIHPQRRFGNPLRTFWAILCEPFSPKSRFFLDTPKFYALYAGNPNVPPPIDLFLTAICSPFFDVTVQGVLLSGSLPLRL